MNEMAQPYQAWAKPSVSYVDGSRLGYSPIGSIMHLPKTLEGWEEGDILFTLKQTSPYNKDLVAFSLGYKTFCLYSSFGLHMGPRTTMQSEYGCMLQVGSTKTQTMSLTSWVTQVRSGRLGFEFTSAWCQTFGLPSIPSKWINQLLHS